MLQLPQASPFYHCCNVPRSPLPPFVPWANTSSSTLSLVDCVKILLGAVTLLLEPADWLPSALSVTSNVWGQVPKVPCERLQLPLSHAPSPLPLRSHPPCQAFSSTPMCCLLSLPVLSTQVSPAQSTSLLPPTLRTLRAHVHQLRYPRDIPVINGTWTAC